jgi:hypothetical protein
MKRWMKAAAAVVMVGAAAVSQARTDVGVSVEISQPGVFGRVDIGRFPEPPQVVVRAPVIVMPQRQAEYAPEPVYLWVPPEHRRDWRRHCGRYDACGVPVYFVRENWYQDNVHRGRGRWDDRRGDDRRGDRGDGRGDGRWDERRDNGRGHGNGHGRD